MSQDLCTLHSYWSVEEAHLARVQLEAAGIRAFISDEQTLGMAWHLGNALQGAKLQVREEDVEQAEAILAEAGAGTEIEDAWQIETADGQAFDAGQLDDVEEDEPDAEDDGVFSLIELARQPVMWILLGPPVLCIAILIVVFVFAMLQPLLPTTP